MSADLLSALMGVQYSGKEDPFGIAAQALAGSANNLNNPYGSVGRNAAATIGASLLAGLLAGIGQNRADSRNAELQPIIGEFMTADPTRQEAMIAETPRLSKLGGAMGAINLQNRLELAQKTKEAEIGAAADVAKAQAMIPVEQAKQLALMPGEITKAARTAAAQKSAEIAAQSGSPLTKEQLTNLEKDYAMKIASLPQTTTFAELSRQIRTLDESLKQDNPVAATTSIYALAKVLDPTSVVRESDYKVVADPGSPAQVLNSVLSQIKGEGRLTPQIKANIKAMMGPILEANYATYKDTTGSLVETLKDQGGAADRIHLLPKPVLAASAPTPPTPNIITAPDGKKIILVD